MGGGGEREIQRERESSTTTITKTPSEVERKEESYLEQIVTGFSTLPPWDISDCEIKKFCYLATGHICSWCRVLIVSFMISVRYT